MPPDTAGSPGQDRIPGSAARQDVGPCPHFAREGRCVHDAGRLTSAEEANALPIGSVIVMHHRDAAPVPHPGLTWLRIERGWINSFGSEVPARADWPHIGQLGGPSAVTVVFRADVR